MTIGVANHDPIVPAAEASAARFEREIDGPVASRSAESDPHPGAAQPDPHDPETWVGDCEALVALLVNVYGGMASTIDGRFIAWTPLEPPPWEVMAGWNRRRLGLTTEPGAAQGSQAAPGAVLGSRASDEPQEKVEPAAWALEAREAAQRLRQRPLSLTMDDLADLERQLQRFERLAVAAIAWRKDAVAFAIDRGWEIAARRLLYMTLERLEGEACEPDLLADDLRAAANELWYDGGGPAGGGEGTEGASELSDLADAIHDYEISPQTRIDHG